MMQDNGVDEVLRTISLEVVPFNQVVEKIEFLPTTVDVLAPNGSLASVRLKLIHAARFEDLRLLLSKLKSRAEVLSESDVVDLVEILLFNVAWHQGKLDECEKRLNSGLGQGSFESVFSLFAAYYLNTIGRFRESSELLAKVRQDDQISEFMNLITGVDLKCAANTWMIWNRIETLNYDGIAVDLRYINRVFDSPGAIPLRSAAMLLMACGVFFYVHDNYADALRMLKRAKEYSLSGDATWLPRINSVLAVAEFRGGDAASSARYLDEALQAIGGHFGPSGWMLRIANCLDMHGRHSEATNLFRRVHEEAVRKGEVGYDYWGRIFMAERGDINVSLEDLFEQCNRRGMKRACNYMVRKSMVA